MTPTLVLAAASPARLATLRSAGDAQVIRSSLVVTAASSPIPVRSARWIAISNGGIPAARSM